MGRKGRERERRAKVSWKILPSKRRKERERVFYHALRRLGRNRRRVGGTRAKEEF